MLKIRSRSSRGESGLDARASCRGITDSEQLDLEDQRGVRRDDAGSAAFAVGEVGGDGQLAFAADLHGEDTFIPTFDHLADADLELERHAAIDRAVELLSVG